MTTASFDERGFDMSKTASRRAKSKLKPSDDFMCFIDDLPDLLPLGLPLGQGGHVAWNQISPGQYLVKDADAAIAMFLRVSTDSQFDSLQTQAEMAVREAKRRGVRIGAVYVDPAISATRNPVERRPGARSLLRDIRQQKVQCVIAYKRDRLARNVREFLDFFRLCRDTNTALVYTCPGEAPSGTGAYGAFSEVIFAALAQLETDITRMRVVDSMISRVSNGDYVGGNLPFGLMWNEVGDQIVPHPDESLVVQEMFRLASDEMLGSMRIAMKLNETFPNSRRGKPWNAVMVSRILSYRSYCGYFTLDTTVDDDGQRKELHVEGRSALLPILIPEELWNRVAEMRHNRRPQAAGESLRYRASPNLLGGIVRCGCCGSVMRPRIMNQHRVLKNGQATTYYLRYYMCQRGQIVAGCDYRGQVNLDRLDEVVLTTVNRVLREGDFTDLLAKVRAQRLESVSVAEDRLTRIQADVAKVEGAIARNQQLLESALENEEIGYFRSRIKELVSQRCELQADQLRVEDAVESSTRSSEDEESAITWALEWPERWDQAPPEQRRRMVLEVLDHVTFHPESRSVDVVFRFRVPGTNAAPETLTVRSIPIPIKRQRHKH